MTNFILRKFVKDYENVQDDQVRTRYVVAASIVGILCNVLLFAGKFLSGIFMQSIAVTADAFNNLSDAASSIISYVGMKMASKPADEEHPFGHGRIEYISAFIVAFLVIEVGFSLLKTSIDKILHPEEVVFQVIPFVMLGISVLVKFWLGRFNKKLGTSVNAKVLEATAADCFGDMTVTSATMAAILIGYFFKINIDGIAGLIVSGLVMWAGVNIAKDTLEPLIGAAVDPEFCKLLTSKVEAYDGIVGTHDLIVHNYGPNRSMASIHAEVPRDVDIEQSHEIIDRIEREVSRELGIFLVIHMDPVETKDEELLQLKKKLHHIMQAIDEKVSFHDFRMVNGEEQINLIFDVVIPYSYTNEQRKETLARIRSMVKQVDARYECVITVDHSYVANITKENYDDSER